MLREVVPAVHQPHHPGVAELEKLDARGRAVLKRDEHLAMEPVAMVTVARRGVGERVLEPERREEPLVRLDRVIGGEGPGHPRRVAQAVGDDLGRERREPTATGDVGAVEVPEVRERLAVELNDGVATVEDVHTQRGSRPDPLAHHGIEPGADDLGGVGDHRRGVVRAGIPKANRAECCLLTRLARRLGARARA